VSVRYYVAIANSFNGRVISAWHYADTYCEDRREAVNSNIFL